MATCFLDTSALVKCYHEEPGTPEAIAIIEAPDSQLRISYLTLVEWHSAFVRKVRMGNLTSEAFQADRALFYADLLSRTFQIVPLEYAHHRRAIGLLLQHGQTHGLRTLDALQFAVALDFHRHTSLDASVCADANLCHIARLEGLSVINPEIG